MTRLKLYLLGPFQATLDDIPLAGLRSNKGRGLLAYLASQPGLIHQRETLATLLWGENSTEAARLSLRVALSCLREVLTPLLDTPADLPLLQISRHTVQFNVNPATCWVDVAALDACLAVCATHAHMSITHCPACMQHLLEVAPLYRGDFLAGLNLPDSPAFDEWRVIVQEQVHRQYLAVLHQITRHYLASSDFAAAQVYARRQLVLEPWREEAHRQLMAALAAEGQRCQALAQYQACCGILAAELNTQPEAATTDLYHQVLVGSVVLERPAAPRPSARLFAPSTPFVGRAAELRWIGESLADPACRLLTLVGPGGIGKSRLAWQAAAQHSALFPGGASYVSLDGCQTPDDLTRAVTESLGAWSAPGEAISWPQLANHLRADVRLLILDDCAPSAAVATWIADLLHHAPNIKVLVVSRQRLNLRGEWLVRLQGLTYPAATRSAPLTHEELLTEVEKASTETYSAVQLFLQCARRAAPDNPIAPADLADVIGICELVEGMPLAIELAAAWLPLLSCCQIAQEIRGNLDFLTTSVNDVPARQRSLRIVFDQVWASLSASEQETLARLTVFHGCFDRDAAVKVAGATLPILSSLVDKSVLRRVTTADATSAPRYALHRLFRPYAAQWLASRQDSRTPALKHAQP